jgi:hypothetical protein
MYPVSVRFLRALAAPHVKISTATHRNLITGVTTNLPIKGGAVTVDSTAANRRSLTLTIPPTQALWDTLDTVGGEITVRQGIRYVGGQIEWVPLGVFIVDEDGLGYSPAGDLQLTCPDRWLKVQRNKMPLAGRGSVPSNAAWQEIKRLVEGAWPGGTYPFPGWSQLDTTATGKVGSVLWDDGQRDTAALGLANDNSLQVFFDPNGLAVLRPTPVLTDTSTPVWAIAAGAAGVLIDASRSRDRSRLFNVVVVSTTATDVAFDPVEVKNTTPGDPYAVDGPLGYVATDYSSATIRNSTQARAAGLTRLSKTLGVGKQLTLENIGNPALDADDVLAAVLPPTETGAARGVELHISDSLTVPLVPTDTQSITTRSTRPSTDGA